MMDATTNRCSPRAWKGWRVAAAIVMLLALVSQSRADGVAYRVRITGPGTRPQIEITNESNFEITEITIPIGDTEQHFAVYEVEQNASMTTKVEVAGNTYTDLSVDPAVAAMDPAYWDNTIKLECTGFGPREVLTVKAVIDNDRIPGFLFRYVEQDNDGQWAFAHGISWREVMTQPFLFYTITTPQQLWWGGTVMREYNGIRHHSWSVINVKAGTHSEGINLFPYRSTYFSATRPDLLRIRALTEVVQHNRQPHFVRGTVVYINDLEDPVATDITDTTIPVLEGDTLEIVAPKTVYKDVCDKVISTSAESGAEPEKAEQRFTAIGISVDDESQTGDPTYYRFEYTPDIDEVVIKYEHEFALTIDQDFGKTRSAEVDDAGNAWAGPLESPAEGNPAPTAKRHWIKRGASVAPEVDGQVLDFSRPGLDIRYLCKGYRAYGPPNTDVLPLHNNDAVDDNSGSTNFLAAKEVYRADEFPFMGDPERRQGITPFSVDRPAGITYVWQIQYGVRVNVDDAIRRAFPSVFLKRPTGYLKVGEGEGVFWFDPGTPVAVASPAIVTVDNEDSSLKGWIAGDGWHFGSSGTIDDAHGGGLTSGWPMVTTNGAVAQWKPHLEPLPVQALYDHRAMEIPELNRAAKVMWRYGPPAIAITVPIGMYVFQDDALDGEFPSEPEQIEVVPGDGDGDVGVTDVSVWDPVAKKLYPVRPGVFKATWQRKGDAGLTEVIVTAEYPLPRAHYQHVAGSPPVDLDPDPDDDFVFKELKYSEGNGSIGDGSLFTADQEGKSVLLFSQIQRQGRGQPREYLQVRVVETRDWDNGKAADTGVIVGQRIDDPDLDRAELGTGYVLFPGARYNPYVYDSAKLEGLAAPDVYDMEVLNTISQRVVVGKSSLPGPIIPVNVHPAAAPTQRIVVVWYDDPLENDRLMWPYRARIYVPRWPRDVSEGLGRIVIASQYGSESLGVDGSNQTVVGEFETVVTDDDGNVITNTVPAETTYNPSRLQAVQVYSQPDPDKTGYNPNEEHALVAPSLRYADVSPRPPAIYALRANDLNEYDRAYLGEDGQPADYTSHPFVLVQFLDTADSEQKMRVYHVVVDDPLIDGYRFAEPGKMLSTTPPRTMLAEPHVTMEAGEPVIPFYPLGVVIGASPCPETYGTDVKSQSVYWEDHKGSSWAVSGGQYAWFTHFAFYPMAPDFWWPDKTGTFVRKQIEVGPDVLAWGLRSAKPQAGDSISFLPASIALVLATPKDTDYVSAADLNFRKAINRPTRVLFKSDWPDTAPILKAGETLTFQGGEYRADHPFSTTIDENGDIAQVETPGLPGVVAFATAEVVFDSLNPTAHELLMKGYWTARIAQVLETRNVPLSLADFPVDLLPATGRTRVKQGKYVFNELPASLQKRILYDPIGGKLEIIGLLNDKDIGERTLTAAPPAVYVLEPNIVTSAEKDAMLELSEYENWQGAVDQLCRLSRNPNLVDSNFELSLHDTFSGTHPPGYEMWLEDFWMHYYGGEEPDYWTAQMVSNWPTLADLGATDPVPPPVPITQADDAYMVGLEPAVVRDSDGTAVTFWDPVVTGLVRTVRDPKRPAPMRAFGPGLALIPNGGFLNPEAAYPDISWVVVAENNDPSMGGSPITLHVIKVDRRHRYRGAIKTIASDNVFDENLTLRHMGDFGARADDLVFDWWYRPDDGSLNVPPPDLLKPGQTNPWKLFPDPSGERGRARFQITLKGNPNAPEALLADTWWFCRYRHHLDNTDGTDWNVEQYNGDDRVNFTWAGAGNSDPFNDFDNDGIMDYRAQLAMGWIKRVLDAVNPYEARIRDFEGDNPATVSSMIAEFGPRFEGPVALNPDKNVIENVGLIELYETILKRGRDLSIDLSRPVATPAIANALQLASTRISDFYTILGNEAYTDALDPTIGYGSSSAAYGSLAPAIFTFQNQMASLIEEELSLLRGVDDYFARPVYNRLFWNFTKGEGEVAYAMNYNISDVTVDGFIDEDDAMALYPQGHGDAWGHYLTALRNQYDLLGHRYFNWVSRSEFYNLMDIVIKVDFLDERKFAQVAAAKARTGAEIVNLTYRDKYVQDSTAQWQGYTDSLKDRSWGVQGWARRSAQGAYFDWVTANALLPSEHPNERLEGVQKVDRRHNADIAVISANLNSIQRTFDDANNGLNPLGLSAGTVPFDLNPAKVESIRIGRTHFEQVYDKAVLALKNVQAIWDNANLARNMLRKTANSEAAFRNSVYQGDLSYKNRLIKIFGKPYEGTIGSGKVYPAGYDGPDTLLYMYVDVRTVDETTVPGPATSFADFSSGELDSGDIYNAYENNENDRPAVLGSIQNPRMPVRLTDEVMELYAPTFIVDSGTAPIEVENGVYAVDYTDLDDPKVPLTNMDLPVMAAGYTFQAPRDWGSRVTVGELQVLVNKMVQQEAQVARAIGGWDGLQGDIVRTLRLLNAKVDMMFQFRVKNELYSRIKFVINYVFDAIDASIAMTEALSETVFDLSQAVVEGAPKNFPTAGVAVSPGDAAFAARLGAKITGGAITTTENWTKFALTLAKFAQKQILAVADNELKLWEGRESDAMAIKQMLVGLENKVGDEPIKRIAIFKEIEALRALSEQYKTSVDQAARLIDERAAYNKRVAAQTQRNRYQDMTFRVARNHALQSYRSAFELAAKYTYLAAKAYDYETNFDASDAGSPGAIYGDIIRARGIGYFSGGEPRQGKGGLCESLGKLKANYTVLRSQLGISNPQAETGKMSLRTELFRIMPKGTNQPDRVGFPGPVGTPSDDLWRAELLKAKVDDLWMVPEFRYFCRPFAAESTDDSTHMEEPGLVFRFGTEITAGKNFFGKPLSGADHAYDPSHYATKVLSVGVWFSDYESDDVLDDLAQAPRVYLVPVGSDIMSISTSDDPTDVRMWDVVDQRIPVPVTSTTADLDQSNWIPLLDSLNGRLGDPRKFPAFRAYHNAADDYGGLVTDSRLIGRSVWNTEWLLIIPGRMLNEDPSVGLTRFIAKVSDVKLVFSTYGYSGN